jgi:hypothetical protein
VITIYSNGDTSKLQPYWNACNSTDYHDNISAPSESAWADGILGLNTSRADKRPLAVEVDAYLLDSQFSTTALNFWQVCCCHITTYYEFITYQIIGTTVQENQLRFPTIFAYATDILPIQASAVPSERVFSSAKETTTARRNKLNHELMEALQILKFANNKGNYLDFTAGTSRSVEMELLESMADEEGIAPEDIMAFIDTLGTYEMTE